MIKLAYALTSALMVLPAASRASGADSPLGSFTMHYDTSVADGSGCVLADTWSQAAQVSKALHVPVCDANGHVPKRNDKKNASTEINPLNTSARVAGLQL